MKHAAIVFVVLWACAVSTEALAQVEITSNALRLTFGGRLHFQGRTSSCSDFPIEFDSACTLQAPGFDMFLRRVRFMAEITYNDWIKAKIQPDYGLIDRLFLADAYGQLLFSEAASLKIGRFKRPFDGFQMISSTQILTIERDIDVPGVSSLTASSYDEFTTLFRLSERDIGMQFEGKSGRFSYWLGMFNGGSLIQRQDDNTEVQFIGRGQVSFAVGRRPARLAVAAAATDRAFTNAAGGLDARYFPAFELWGEIGTFDYSNVGDCERRCKHVGPHIQAGIVFGQNPLLNQLGDTPDLATDELAKMFAWQIIGSFMFPVHAGRFLEAIQPVLRLTMADANTDQDDDIAWGITPGIQIFFDGRNKVAANWDFAVFQDDAVRSENSFKFQYYFHF